MLKFRSTVASALSSTPGICIIVAMLLVEAASQDYWQFWLLAVLLAASQPAACILGLEKSFNYLAIWGFTPRIMGTGLIGFGSLVYVLTAIQPAHAIFFATAETWFASKFGAIPGFATTLTLAVNLLRALFVVFIIWSFLKIVEARQSGQDASQLFQTLLVTVLAGFFGDEVLKLFI